MEAHQPRARILCAEAVPHQSIPNLACSPVLRDLLEEIIVRVEKEAQPWPKLIHFQTPPPRPLHVLHAVIDRECEFLQGGRARLADVVSADGDRVKPRSEFRSELERVHHQTHAGCRRVDVFLLCDVLL